MTESRQATTEELVLGFATTAVTVADVKAGCGVSETTARKTLAALVASGRVTAEKKGKVTWYQTTPAKRGGGGAATSREEARARDAAILELLREKGGMGGLSKFQVAEELGMSASLAYMSLWRLEKSEAVEVVLSGRRAPNYAAVGAVGKSS